MGNLILKTDSYKLTHWNQYPRGTTGVYSYFESREGAEYDETVFFGLQAIIRQFLVGSVVTENDVHQAATIAATHFGDENMFNYAGWLRIAREHGGRLPVRIRAVPEGTPVPVSNVLMTVENTDPECYWLTNALESILTHVWYPSTVASRSRSVKKLIASKLEGAGSPLDGLPFMLHDFGYRGATTDDAAAIGGAAHLVNFLGTDTLVAMELAMEHYGATLESLAFSVPATEHSVMTSLGRHGEMEIVQNLLDNHQNGIISVVADSYNIYEFVQDVGERFKAQILGRDGVFVVRPDSITQRHDSPEKLVLWVLESLWKDFGGTETSKGFKVLDPHVRVLWGDGIEERGIEKILNRMMLNGFAPDNIATFGMGGGLLQKLNRDTQRSAFKSSAQERGGEWFDVSKDPLDASKKSKAGRLDLYRALDGRLLTSHENGFGPVDPKWKMRLDHVDDGLLETVFLNGHLVREQTFADIRERAAI